MILNPSLKQRLISTNLLPKDATEPSENADGEDSTSQTNSIKPPDFSKLREMTVAEPTNKFVPPQKSEQEEST